MARSPHTLFFLFPNGCSSLLSPSVPLLQTCPSGCSVLLSLVSSKQQEFVGICCALREKTSWLFYCIMHLWTVGVDSFDFTEICKWMTKINDCFICNFSLFPGIKWLGTGAPGSPTCLFTERPRSLATITQGCPVDFSTVL